MFPYSLPSPGLSFWWHLHKGQKRFEWNLWTASCEHGGYFKERETHIGCIDFQCFACQSKKARSSLKCRFQWDIEVLRTLRCFDMVVKLCGFILNSSWNVTPKEKFRFHPRIIAASFFLASEMVSHFFPLYMIGVFLCDIEMTMVAKTLRKDTEYYLYSFARNVLRLWNIEIEMHDKWSTVARV